MVRTKEKNAAYQDEQQETQGTVEEGFEQDLHFVVSMMLLENVLLGDVTCANQWAGLSEESEQANESEKEPPGISIADAWLAEPEWVGESSEAKSETAAGSREPEE